MLKDLSFKLELGKAGATLFQETILVVDDDPTNLRFLQEILKADYKIYAAPSAERALVFLEKKLPDLILLDVEMPGMSGYEMITKLKSDYRWTDIPVIFLTALEGRENEYQAFKLGAVDYITKPISAGVVRARVSTHLQLENYKKNLEELVQAKTSQLLKTQDTILDMLSNVTAYRDNETGAHIKRTTYFVQELINMIVAAGYPGYEITQEQALDIVKGAKLHDIGKVAIPDGILLKPGKLTDAEFEIIKKHATMGGEILDDAIVELGDDSSFLNVAHEIVVSHHEWWSGRGYPYGLEGDQIPISGRIMAIADVYDALISKRPYKEPLSHARALEIIMGDSGTHFDPVMLSICEPAFDRFPEIANTYRDENYEAKILI